MTKYEGKPDIIRLEVEMPRMIGTQTAVANLLKQCGIPQNLSEETVFIFGRQLSDSNELIADELVRLLQLREAKEVIFIGCPEEFEVFLLKAAKRRKFERLRKGSLMDLSLP